MPGLNPVFDQRGTQCTKGFFDSSYNIINEIFEKMHGEKTPYVCKMAIKSQISKNMKNYHIKFVRAGRF